MKLRSASRAVAASEMDIPFMLPATHEIFISNASSPLLRLPQELKDSIYRFVYAGSYIHIVDLGERFRLLACNDGPNHHHVRTRGYQTLSFASLRTCRQMYHEARSVLYSVNTFEIGRPIQGRLFLQTLSDRSLTLRSLHLSIILVCTQDERDWNHVFYEMAKNLKNIRDLYVHILEVLWVGYYRGIRQSPAFGKKPFLKGLLELKKLPLKTLEICMRDNFEGRHYHSHGISAYTNKYIWTPAQQQEWAESMKSAILGTS